MVELVGLLGLISFVVASLVVGIRILLLAVRTRLLPETTVGLSLVLAGGFGTALTIAPLFAPTLSENVHYVLIELGSASSHLGFGLLFFFVWRVFHPNEVWAALLFGATVTGLAVGAAGMAIELEPGHVVTGSHEADGLWFWLSMGARFVGYSWAAIESFRYYRLMKRRSALGLADEAVASRFFHWGVAMTAVLGIWINMSLRQIAPSSELLQSSSNLLTAFLGFVVAGALWMAFFPSEKTSESTSASDLSNQEGSVR